MKRWLMAWLAAWYVLVCVVLQEAMMHHHHKGDEEEDEEEEMPEDLKDLDWETQQFRIKLRRSVVTKTHGEEGVVPLCNVKAGLTCGCASMAVCMCLCFIYSFYMMAVGTVLVLIFSDPMVDVRTLFTSHPHPQVSIFRASSCSSSCHIYMPCLTPPAPPSPPQVLSEVGKRTGIPSFYISFVLSPLVSNASELIASYNYAQKKTSKTITISLATLVGAGADRSLSI